MTRRIVFTIVLILAAAALAAVALILYLRSSVTVLDGPGMEYEDTFDFSGTWLRRVYYYRGGGENGDSYSVELTFGETRDGRPRALVRYHDRPAHDQKAVEKEIVCTSNVVTGVQEIVDRYSMTDWKDLPETDLFALDAPSMSFTLEYSDGTEIRLGSDLEMPDGAYKAIEEIRSYILMCAGIEEE